MRLKIYFFIFFVNFFGFCSWANAENVFLFTDLRDVAKFQSQQHPIISKILSYLQECESCRPDHLNFFASGPNKLPSTRVNSLYGVELISQPQLNADNTVKFTLQAVGSPQTGQIFYYRGEFYLSADFKKALRVEWKKYNLTQNSQIDLIISRWERKLLLKSHNPSFIKVYPIGLGGFSLNNQDLQTPKLEGQIQNNHSRFYESREEPWYYYGFPFLGVLDKSARYTMYGLHATLLPASEIFNRGFVSTGCIHMQVKDVYEIYSLIKWGTPRSATLSIRDSFPKEYAVYDSPVPFNNSFHYRVADGSKGDDGLTKMIRINSPPPINQPPNPRPAP